MKNTFGSVAPKERINIRYRPATGGETAEIELPHKMLVIGDFGLEDGRALDDRPVMRIDKHSFDDVLSDAGVRLDLNVPSSLSPAADAELAISLRLGSINDFSPDRIARQVPQLDKLLQLREALVALKGPMGNLPAFRQQLQKLLNDPHTRQQLAHELALVIDDPELNLGHGAS